MSVKKKNKVKSIRDDQRSYLNRDFNSFRASLTEYGQVFFGEKNADFGPSGFAGMMVELASYVGDVMSYYMDHQFQELDLNEATEVGNVERLIRNTGVKIFGAAPATVDVNFYLEIPATQVGEIYIPDVSLCPIIKAGTTVSSGNGTVFTLLEDVNFRQVDIQGIPTCEYVTMKSDPQGNPTTFSVKKSGPFISSVTQIESFIIPDTFKPFRKVTLSQANVADIIEVTDSEGNEYYEVDSLTQDTVFKRVDNIDTDSVEERLEIIPAPRRFITNTSIRNKRTTVVFGGGNAESTDDDIMPDPSDLSIPLYGKRKTVSNFTIDPNRLMKSLTLGISPKGTTIKIKYRSGGGIRHNVSAGSIRNISNLRTKFLTGVPASTRSSIRSSAEVNNIEAAAGGENAPTLNEMRAIALAHKNSQSRIVTKSDLIARIYAMPTKFGRVFRVGVRPNPNNPLTSVVSIISRDSSGKLSISPDTLKRNLSIFLNESRLIADAIDIVDAPVANVRISYGITISATANSESVIQSVNTKIREYMALENFQIDQPLVVSDIANIILNTKDVVSLLSMDFRGVSGTIDNNVYTDFPYNPKHNTIRGSLIPPEGGMFELRFPDDDIIGSVR